MRAWLIIAALALAGPALAVPPIPPKLEAGQQGLHPGDGG